MRNCAVSENTASWKVGDYPPVVCPPREVWQRHPPNKRPLLFCYFVFHVTHSLSRLPESDRCLVLCCPPAPPPSSLCTRELSSSWLTGGLGPPTAPPGHQRRVVGNCHPSIHPSTYGANLNL